MIFFYKLLLILKIMNFENVVLIKVVHIYVIKCCNLTLREVWGWNSQSRIGTWESSGTLETSEFNCKGQNTLHWGVLYIIGKLLKCRCRKWPRMDHLDICNTSYGQKKDRESNCQFDSRPLKVGNRPNSSACRWSATHCWRALKESYNFSSDLIPIRGLSKELRSCKVPGV
jgi:hypothetical protein